MIPTTQTGVILVTTSIEVVLSMTIIWLQKLNHSLSNISSVVLAIAGMVIAYYTVLHLREKWIGQKLDNQLKRKQLEDESNID